jgi:nickel-dependent lactate racemase
MAKSFALPYGKTTLHFSLSEANFLGCIDIPEFPGVADAEQAVLGALRNPIQHSPLSDWVQGARKVVVTCPDITREAQARLYFPVLLAELNRAGVRDGQIELCFALGNHRELSEREMEGIVGSPILKRLTFFQSQAQRTDEFRSLGRTERGTPVWFNKRVLAADRIILTGGVVFHVFAGFGGGRKGLLPGVARLDTVMTNHSYMLSPRDGGGMNPNCTTGVLQGNPIHEDMMDAAVRVPNVFLLNTVLNLQKEIAGVFAGDLQQAHAPAVAMVRSRYGVPIRQQADFVIFSPGGFPRDLSFYQAFLSLERAARTVRPGGAIILVAECPEGTDEEERFQRWFDLDDRLCVEREMRRDFDNVGLIAHDMHRFSQTFRVLAVTAMCEQDVKKLLMEPVPTLDEALDRMFRHLGPEAKGYVMPRGSYTVPVQANG